ncbi:MAG: hypothetical protein ACPGGJ_02085, partial [Coraliomargarita sp.]
MIRRVAMIGWCAAAIALALALATGKAHLLRPDQQAHALYSNGQYKEAAGTYRDPFWRAVALYRDGQFEEASGAFAGFDS